MFEKNTDYDVYNRLSVLHLLAKYKTNIEKDILINFFIVSGLYNYLEINDIIDILKENNLLKEINEKISLTENGIVTHSFFINKLPIDRQKEIENLMQKNSLLDENYHSIVKMSDNDLTIKIASGKKMKMDLKIDIQEYETISLDSNQSKQLFEEISNLIKKHIETI